MANVSVVIPAYNRAQLIGETLRSLLAQTLPASEIIVVDDGSADDTARIAESFGPPVRVIRRPNGGPAAARNTGFAASSGDFIHFFDSDDLAAPNKHEVQVGALLETGADIAYGPWVQGRFENGVFAAANKVLQQHGLPREKSLAKALLTDWSIVPHAALFARGIVEKVRGFPADLFVAEDQEMFLRCLLAGARVVHTPGTIEFYRLGNDDKITGSRDAPLRRLRDWARFLVGARAYCLEHGMEPLHWFGYRLRVWEAERDLRAAECDDEALVERLHALLRACRTPSACYRWRRRIERWKGGLQWRLTGGRAHGYFRIGRIRPGQLSQLEQLGYKQGVLPPS